jgi:hypothetical protein
MEAIRRNSQSDVSTLNSRVSIVILSIRLWGWSGTQSTITAASYGSIVPALDDGDDCEAISGMYEWQGN